MEDKKLYDLKLEVKEIAGIACPTLQCQLEVLDHREIVKCKNQVVLGGLEITPSCQLSLNVINGERLLGSLKISFGTLFTESLQGKFDKWFKLKSEEFTNLRAKISAMISKTEKPKKKSSTPARKSSKASVKDPKCPFLETLASGKCMNTEPLDALWRGRDANSENYIKISIEPDSPTRLDTESAEITAEKLEKMNFDQLQHMPGSQLKQSLKILCEEAKHSELISLNLAVKKQELNSRVQERRELEMEAQEEMNKIKASWVVVADKYSEMNEKRSILNCNLIDQREVSKKLEDEIGQLKGSLGDLVRENMLFKTQRLQFEDCALAKKDLENLLKHSQEKKSILIEQIAKGRSEIDQSKAKTAKEIEIIKKDVEGIKAKIIFVEEENKKAQEENAGHKLQINDLRAKLSNPSNLKLQVKTQYEIFQNESRNRDSLSSELKALHNSLHISNQEILKSNSELLANSKDLAGKLAVSEQCLESEENSIQDLQKRTFEALNKKVYYEQMCCIRADVSQVVEDLSKLNSFHSDCRNILLSDLEAASKILMEESLKVYGQAERLDQIIDAVDKKEEELEGLKNTMGEVKKRQPPYVPVKDDPVDAALAEYLNAKEVQVPIKFIRQEGGNYTFGTKKVYVKVENGRLLVKVGGGFTSIDEFLSIYTLIEQEKADSSPKANAGLMSLAKFSKDASPGTVAQKFIGVFDSLGKSSKKS